ncbi:MAG: hypothetical protein BWY11_00069 [Firmicutes bacterium ADurb.Bin182]|nr:MAG: hypothetical protein BWY11_00069 [Firmicutes bacterium ADurb.Bin182]
MRLLIYSDGKVAFPLQFPVSLYDLIRAFSGAKIVGMARRNAIGVQNSGSGQYHALYFPPVRCRYFFIYEPLRVLSEYSERLAVIVPVCRSSRYFIRQYADNLKRFGIYRAHVAARPGDHDRMIFRHLVKIIAIGKAFLIIKIILVPAPSQKPPAFRQAAVCEVYF